MARDNFDSSSSRHCGRTSQPDGDGRPAACERSEEERFLNGAGRFKRQSECQNSISVGDHDGGLATATGGLERRSGQDRRSGRDRRCGYDTRSEVERFLQGERRSGIDRRTRNDRRYRTFKKARAFARSLGLNSQEEWRDYVNSGMAPGDIPAAPHEAYANEGWAGWGDWLGASPVATYLSRYQSFGVARALVRGLHSADADDKATERGE